MATTKKDTQLSDTFTQSFDAQVWAKAFVEHVRLKPSIATDEGTMIGWFANAIMRGYDEYPKRERQNPPVPQVIAQLEARLINDGFEQEPLQVQMSGQAWCGACFKNQSDGHRKDCEVLLLIAALDLLRAMPEGQTALDRGKLIDLIMARKHGASGTAVFVDPIILGGLIDKAIAPAPLAETLQEQT